MKWKTSEVQQGDQPIDRERLTLFLTPSNDDSHDDSHDSLHRRGALYAGMATRFDRTEADAVFALLQVASVALSEPTCLAKVQEYFSNLNGTVLEYLESEVEKVVS